MTAPIGATQLVAISFYVDGSQTRIGSFSGLRPQISGTAVSSTGFVYLGVSFSGYRATFTGTIENGVLTRSVFQPQGPLASFTATGSP